MMLRAMCRRGGGRRLAARVLPVALLLAVGAGVAPAAASSVSPLVVSVSGLPATVDATHTATFGVSVTNTGSPQTSPSLTVSTTLGSVALSGPSGWTCSGATCDYTSSRAFKNRATASFSASLTGPDPLTCVGAQSPAGSMTCPITVTATSTDDSLLTATASAGLNGIYPDVAVSAAAPTNAAAGTVVAFTSTITNGGSGAATGVTLTDSLPPLAAAGTYASFAPGSSSASCAASSAGVVTCTPGTIPAGGTATVTVAVLAPPLAVNALGQQMQNAVAAADAEEGSNPVTPADDASASTTVVYDGYSPNAGGGSKTSTPGLGNGHDQTTVVSLSSSVTPGAVFVYDSLATATCASTGATLYGNPVTITSPVAPNSDPNTVQLIYDSGPGGIPVGQSLGNIQVIRQATLGVDQPCFVLSQCGVNAGKAILPSGDVSCVSGVKRSRPTGIVTITVLDTGGDPSFRGSG